MTDPKVNRECDKSESRAVNSDQGFDFLAYYQQSLAAYDGPDLVDIRDELSIDELAE